MCCCEAGKETGRMMPFGVGSAPHGIWWADGHTRRAKPRRTPWRTHIRPVAARAAPDRTDRCDTASCWLNYLVVLRRERG